MVTVTERFLVVDNGWIGKNEGCFQYVVVDIEGDMKTFSNYTCIKGNIHSSSLAKMTQDAFDRYGCDYIVLDCCGTGMCILDSLNKKYFDYVVTYKYDRQSINNGLHHILKDMQSRRLFIEKDSTCLYDIIRYIDNGIYFDVNGFAKLSWKTLDDEVRKLFHVFNGFYMGINDGSDIVLFKDYIAINKMYGL